MAPFLMARHANTYSDCVNQIVADQAGSDCDRKLGPGRARQPVLIPGNVVVQAVPPAVDKTSCDCQHDEKGEPAARSIEESFRVTFPPGHHQTDQAKKASNDHTSQGESQTWPEPERNQQGEAKKENGGETGRPHIYGGDPAPALSSSGAGAVAQSKGKENHAAESEKNKKQQSKKDDRHPLRLARVRAGLALIRDQRSEVRGQRPRPRRSQNIGNTFGSEHR